jgi:hypothetical protein
LDSDPHTHEEELDWDTDSVREKIEELEQSVDSQQAAAQYWRQAYEELYNERQTAAEIKLKELENKINTPQTEEFFTAVENEVAHQNLRWNDKHKSDTDWFWLVGYLAGKALHNPNPGNNSLEKKRHRVIALAGAVFCWWKSSEEEKIPETKPSELEVVDPFDNLFTQ